MPRQSRPTTQPFANTDPGAPTPRPIWCVNSMSAMPMPRIAAPMSRPTGRIFGPTLATTRGDECQNDHVRHRLRQAHDAHEDWIRDPSIRRIYPVARPTMSSPPPMSRPSKKATITASLEATARMKMSAPASRQRQLHEGRDVRQPTGVPPRGWSPARSSPTRPRAGHRPTSTTTTIAAGRATCRPSAGRCRPRTSPRRPRQCCGSRLRRASHQRRSSDAPTKTTIRMTPTAVTVLKSRREDTSSLDPRACDRALRMITVNVSLVGATRSPDLVLRGALRSAAIASIALSETQSASNPERPSVRQRTYWKAPIDARSTLSQPSPAVVRRFAISTRRFRVTPRVWAIRRSLARLRAWRNGSCSTWIPMTRRRTSTWTR